MLPNEKRAGLDDINFPEVSAVFHIRFPDVVDEPFLEKITDLNRQSGAPVLKLVAKIFDLLYESFVLHLMACELRVIMYLHQIFLRCEMEAGVFLKFLKYFPENHIPFTLFHCVKKVVYNCKKLLMLLIDLIYTDAVGIIPIHKSHNFLLLINCIRTIGKIK